jgi:lysophospholipase L1-like esterase
MMESKGISTMVRKLVFAAGLLLSAHYARAQPPQSPTQAETCAAVPAADPQDMAVFNTLIVEPKKFTSLADLLKALPPEAMAKIGAMQKVAAERQAKDWPWLCRYAAENAAVLKSGVRPKVIFIGDSITENWSLADPSLFNANVLDRGIGGQTTPQILLRFYQDVVALRPQTVHIMAGTNDVSGNTGAVTDQAIVQNIRAMIDIAKANGINVVLASITPSKQFVARPNVDPSPRIAAVNRALVKLAAEKKITYVDYFPALADNAGGLADALGNDGLHPNRDGYAAMRPLTDKAIKRAGKK